eukprot:12910223-Prorocentrum_lima.AAC.1
MRSIDLQWAEALGDGVEHSQVPSATPPHGELALTADDSPYTGDDTSRSSTTPLQRCPSPT